MKKKYIIIPLIALLLAIGWSWRYITMNAYYDSFVNQEKVIFKVGEKVPFEDDLYNKKSLNGYSIQVNRFEVQDFYTYAESIGFVMDDHYYPGEKVALLSITLFNDNSDAEGVMLTDYNLYGVDQIINMDWDLLIAANPILEGNYGITLLPGTECSLVLPYKMQKDYFGTWTWNHLDDYDLYLKLTSYPTEKVIQVQ